MEVFEAIKKRYSCRSYQDKPIKEEKLNQLLEAARLAPSAHNAQERKLIVVKDQAKREQLGKAASQPFIAQAPIIIAAVALNPDDVMSSGTLTYPVDLAIAVDHITLAATELGLATCWIGAFDQEEAKRILNIPKNLRVVALLPLGYPADRIGLKSRKKLDQIVSLEEF